MSTRSEYEAAYFTLLRARDEHDMLLRYRTFLEEESTHLDRVTTAVSEAGNELPRKVRQPIDATVKPLLEAVGRRRSVIDQELRRVPERIDAASAFVTECEEEVARLRP